MVWAYNVDTKEYARLATVPSGAEATGLSVEDNINGFSYITANFQHPGEWLAVHANVKVAAEPLIKRNYKNLDAAAVGYLKSVAASGGSAVQLQPALKQPVAVNTFNAPMSRFSFSGIDYPRAADLNVGLAEHRASAAWTIAAPRRAAPRRSPS
jgi:hypothetical protein